MLESHASSRRNDFLLTHWSRYPAWPSAVAEAFSAWKSGRWPLSLGSEFTSGAKLRWHTLSLGPQTSQPVAPYPMDVLREGDWVSVHEADGEVILWAPKLNEQAFLAQSQLATERWSKLLTSLRQFFLERGFLEASTPILAPSPGTEAYLDSVSVRLRRWDGDEFTRYAITSPEFHLKKLLAAGCTKIFEIARCVRNLEGGEQHALEFHMLEWYRSFASHREIAADLVDLLVSLGGPRPRTRTWVSLVEEVMDQRSAWKHPTLTKLTSATERSEFLRQALQIQERDISERGPVARQPLESLLQALNVSSSANDGVNDLLQRLWLERLENLLAASADVPCIVENFPPALSALARVGTEGWAERFELYWRGLEIANAFHELNDPEENQRRWARDLEEKRRSGRPEVPLDDELSEAFAQGVPPAGGIALGVERLAMALWRVEKINEVRPFVY